MATIAENIQTLRSIKSDIKNAIIQKGGSVTDAFGTYAQAITNLPSGGGGGTENEDALITRTLSGTYYNNRVSSVGNYAFYSCMSLISVNLPNCTKVANNVFAYCYSLTSVNLPLCSYVGGDAFSWCTKLTSVNLPLCSRVDADAFIFCSALSYINLPLCTSVGMWAFQNCTALKSIDLPLCSFIDRDGFYGCTNLTQVYLNSVTRVTSLPYSTTFSNCPKLTSVYVPSSLVDAFKVAPNWSFISNKIVAYTGA